MLRILRSVGAALVALLLAPTAAAGLPVCGTVAAADGSLLPATARAELVPVEPGYDWALGVLAGRADAEPVARSGVHAGRFCLEVPRPGIWRVVVRASGFVPVSRAPLPWPGVRELPPAMLVPDAGVRVEVRDPRGEPVGGAWVLADPADRTLWAGLAGDGWRPEGRFERSGADGGATFARAPGEALEIRAFAGGGLAPAVAAVEGGVGAVRLTLPDPGPQRSLTVHDESGEPLAGVAAIPAAHGWPVAVTGAEGRLIVTLGREPAPTVLLAWRDGRRRLLPLPAVRAPGESAGDGSSTVELPPTPPVRGRILAGPNRHALPGALVWLAPDPGAFAVAGVAGEYSLPGGGRTRVALRAAAADHLPRGGTAEGAGGSSVRAPDLVLQPAVSAAGRVVRGDGSPLAGARLEAVEEAQRVATVRGAGERAPSHAWSDDRGRFTLGGMRPSVPYRVIARHPEFAPLALPGVVLSAGGGAADLGDLVLEAGASIEGRVVDPGGDPVAAAEVRWRPAEGRPAPGEAERLRRTPPAAVAGEDGLFVLSDLPPGRALHLLTTRPGYLPAWTFGVEPPPADPLEVVLEPAARLAGTVVDEAGAGVAGARVVVSPSGSPPGTVGVEARRGGSRSALTEADGTFSFDELVPGGVEVSARAEGLLPSPAEILELPDAAPAGEVPKVRLVLRAGASVEGRVFDPDGEPLGGAVLRIGVAEAVSDAGGQYRLRGLPLGVAGLFVRHPEFRMKVEEVEVGPGINPLDVYLEEGWTVSGRTVDEAGEPVAEARVAVRSESLRPPGVFVAASGPDGRFRIVLSFEGSYRLTATREGFAAAEIAGIEVRSGAVEGVEVILRRGASVAGRVLGLAAAELAMVAVEARREDGDDPGAAVPGTIDPRGRYAIRHLPPGTWRVRAFLGGGRREAAATVVVEPTTRRLEVDLELGAGVRLSGRLLYRGEPVAAAHVALTGLDVSGERSVLTGHDGAFRIEDLAAGRYRLDVTESARALSHVEDLELASDRELVLELEAAPLTGTVTAAESGEPLEGALVYVRKLLAAGETGSLTTVGTDARGGFVVAHLAHGTYAVTARKDGYAPAERRVEVAAGAPPAPLLLPLAAADGLTLTVRFDSGEVPPLVTMSAFDSAGGKVFTDTRRTSGRGFVHFAELRQGTWNLLVSADRAAPAWISATVPDSAPQVILFRAAPLTVQVPALAETDANGVLTLIGADGEPFFQVEPGGALRSRWTVTGGVTNVPDLPAGVWSVRVDGARGGTWLGSVVTDGRSPSRVSLE